MSVDLDAEIAFLRRTASRLRAERNLEIALDIERVIREHERSRAGIDPALLVHLRARHGDDWEPARHTI